MICLSLYAHANRSADRRNIARLHYGVGVEFVRHFPYSANTSINDTFTATRAGGTAGSYVELAFKARGIGRYTITDIILADNPNYELDDAETSFTWSIGPKTIALCGRATDRSCITPTSKALRSRLRVLKTAIRFISI